MGDWQEKEWARMTLRTPAGGAPSGDVFTPSGSSSKYGKYFLAVLVSAK